METGRIARNGNAPETADTLVEVGRLDKGLPPFRFPETLPVGQYNIVFQVQGERGILYRIEKPIYYIADAKFTLNDIHIYHPDFAEGPSPLIPPGTNIILEAQVIADKRLSPYVVWYAGKQRIGEGPLSNGSSQILWKVPQKSGFQSIRAEVFPFKPINGASQAISGKVKELSLPVSSKFEGKGHFTENAETLIRWYQLRGDLHDAAGTGGELAAQNKIIPKWRPYTSNYGLAVGPKDVYTLPDVNFLPQKVPPDTPDSGARGQILIRFAPLSEGVIFSGRFARGDTSSSVGAPYLELSWSDAGLILKLTAGDESFEERIPQTVSGGFITAVINFQFDADRLSAGVQLDSTVFTPSEHTITLPESLNGKGVFQIGSGASSGASSGAGNTDQNVLSPVAIISELGITATPILVEDTPVITGDESDLSSVAG